MTKSPQRKYYIDECRQAPFFISVFCLHLRYITFIAACLSLALVYVSFLMLVFSAGKKYQNRSHAPQCQHHDLLESSRAHKSPGARTSPIPDLLPSEPVFMTPDFPSLKGSWRISGPSKSIWYSNCQRLRPDWLIYPIKRGPNMCLMHGP